MEENQTQASSSIKVVKFTSGEEVVSVVVENNDELTLSHPAKIVSYTTTNSEGQVLECIRLTSYLANIQSKTMTVLKSFVMYVAEPSEDILKMYDAYLAFMNGQTDTTITAELDNDGDAMDRAWELLSDPNFVGFMEELYEDSYIEIQAEEEIEEPVVEPVEQIKPKKKKRKYKKEELKLPYEPDADANDPKSWSDNPEDYYK